MDLTLSLAFVVGLLSIPCCAGMRGGITGALRSYGVGDIARRGSARALIFLLAYNGGRIASYGIAGGAGERLVAALA